MWWLVHCVSIRPSTNITSSPFHPEGTPSAAQFRLSIASLLPPSGTSLKLSSKHPYFYSFVTADLDGNFCSLSVAKGTLLLLVVLDRKYLVNYFVRVHVERTGILKTPKQLSWEEDAVTKRLMLVLFVEPPHEHQENFRGCGVWRLIIRRLWPVPRRRGLGRPRQKTRWVNRCQSS